MNEENNKEVFQCICGKRFEKQTSLISHKSHCKIYQESIKEEKLKRIQEKESKRLPNGMFKCENPDCGKEHDGSYGSGRFCCKECKNRYIALTKINVKNPNVKAHLDKLRAEGKIQYRAPFGTWKCNHCNKIFETRYLLQKHIKDVHLNHIDGLICPFCGKIFKSFQAKGGHIINCKLNPNKAYYDEMHKRVGKKISDKIKSGDILPAWLGKKHSEASKRKMRQAACKYLAANNPHPCRYNKKAIKFFDNLSKEKGWNLQHAENGGEFYTGIGYWLDAYDKERNIVVEYDEPRHYKNIENNILREKDLKRQQEIIDYLHCEYWRYNETTKCLWKVEI